MEQLYLELAAVVKEFKWNAGREFSISGKKKPGGPSPAARSALCALLLIQES